MNNLVLYRKYRPMNFSEFIGQEHIVKTLTNALRSNQTSHAYILSGPRGTGKTTIARVLAKAINCANRKQGEFEPCNKCSSCLEINEGRALDLVEIDAASNRGIDEIRELKERIRFTPVKSKYKVFIIDEAHQLTKEAANALLKTLEEPPSHAVFILATTEIHKMIPTIISRCQRFDFKKFGLEDLIKQLKFVSQQEKIKIDSEAIEVIAFNSEGSLRDAISLLDECVIFSGSLGDEKIGKQDIENLLGLVDTTIIVKFVDLLFEKKEKEALNFIDNMIEKGFDLDDFSKKTVEYLRKAMILKINPELKKSFLIGMGDEDIEKLKKQISGLTIEEIKKIVYILIDASKEMRYSSFYQLPLELAVVEICDKN
ncbi:MAG: DNA polymerase III subunit gamma/tau [bacterium]|nr:DNA polymerase III subunit gamma/tau [bacterium]